MAWQLPLACLLIWCLAPLGGARAHASLASAEQVVSAASRQELLDALTPWVGARLGEHLGTTPDGLHVEALGAWGKAGQAQAPRSWRVTWRPPVARQDGWLVKLEASADAAKAESLELRFLVRQRQAVWRVHAPVNKGDELGCEVLSLQTRIKPAGTRVWQGRCEELAGLVARRPLPAGEVLAEGDVGPRPAVHREQVVQVWSRSHGIEVSAAARVLADAAVGQRVPVRISGSNGVLQATVVSPGVLQIVEGME
jgi:flagella basal body P-ring formation protein FlgA